MAVSFGLLSNCTVTTQGDADHPCVSNQTECNRSPKPNVFLNYVHPQRLHENYFQLCETLLNGTFGREEVIFGKLSYVSKGRLCDASFKDLCTHTISIDRFFSYRHPYVQSTAKYKNIRTKVYCIASIPYGKKIL